MNKEQTGTMIKEARIEKGFTQNDLGNLVGVSNKAVSRWETGESFPDVALLDHLADVLGLSIEELVLGEKKVISLSSKEMHEGEHTVANEENDNMNEQEELYTRTAVKELVQMVKLQKQGGKRKMLYGCLSMAVWACIVALSFISTYRIYSFSWFAGLLLGMTACVIGVSVIMLCSINADREKPVKEGRRLERVLLLISCLTGIYMIALMLSAVLVFVDGYVPFNISEDELGAIVHIQLIFFMVLNAAIVMYYYMRAVFCDKELIAYILVGETNVFLAVMYMGMQHSMVLSLKEIIDYTIIAVMMLATALFAVWQRSGKEKKKTLDDMGNV